MDLRARIIDGQENLQDTVLQENLKAVQAWLDAKGTEHTDDGPGFEYGGVWIANPFYDESLRFEVEPLSYYGIENMMGFIEDAKKQVEAEKTHHSSLDEQISDAVSLQHNGESGKKEDLQREDFQRD